MGPWANSFRARRCARRVSTSTSHGERRAAAAGCVVRGARARSRPRAQATQAEAADAQLAAAAALEVKRGKLALAQRALRERQDEALKQLVLAPLFPELASLVFALLPGDSRLRCREVCRGWRAFLADVRFWQVCDLSATSGVARSSPALLRAASERAHGTLRELDVSGWYRMPVGEGEETLDDEQLLPVLRANTASLPTLRAWKPSDGVSNTIVTAADIEQLFVAAPRLRLLECDAYLEGEEARGPVLRLLSAPQFSPLRLRSLMVNAFLNVQPLPDGLALAAWAAKHPSLQSLLLFDVRLDSQPALDAVASLASSQLCGLALAGCRLTPASLPALARMLESRSLRALYISNGNMPLFVGASMPAFCAALRRSLFVALHLDSVCLWESQADSLAIIAACMGHPTQRTIRFSRNDLENAPGKAVIEAALDALQASNPRLSLLDR